MRTTAKADYAVRAAVELAAVGTGEPVKADQIAEAQSIPLNFLENILSELRRAGIVESRRGAAGGYLLARAPEEISLADVIRAVEGPLANVRGMSPDTLEYGGPPNGCATCGSRCARACAQCSSRSRSPTSQRASSRRTSSSSRRARTPGCAGDG